MLPQSPVFLYSKKWVKTAEKRGKVVLFPGHAACAEWEVHRGGIEVMISLGLSCNLGDTAASCKSHITPV